MSASPSVRRAATARPDPSLRLWDLTDYARPIAGNLEQHVSRLPPEHRDSARLRTWAARVRLARGEPVGE